MNQLDLDETELCMSTGSQDENGVVDMTISEELEAVKEALDDCGFEFLKVAQEYEQVKRIQANFLKEIEIEKEKNEKNEKMFLIEKKRYDDANRKLSDLESENKELIRKKNILAEDLQKKDDKTKLLSTELFTKDVSLNALKHRFEVLNKEFQTIKNKPTSNLSDELSLTKQERNELLMQNEQLRMDLESASRKILQHERNVKDWENQANILHDDFKQKEEELQKNQLEIESLRKDLKSKNHDILSLKNNLLNQQLAFQLEKNNAEMQILKDDLSAKNLETMTTFLKIEIHNLKNSMEYMKNQVINVRRNFVDATTSLKSDADSIIKNILNSHDVAMKEFNNYCGNLFCSLSKTNDQLHSFQNENHKLNIRINEQNSEIERLRNEIGLFQSKKDKNSASNLTEAEYNYFRQQCIDKEIEADQLRVLMVELENEIVSLKDAILMEKKRASTETDSLRNLLIEAQTTVKTSHVRGRREALDELNNLIQPNK